MKTLKERLKEGLASIRQETPQLSASEQAELARVEAYVNGDAAATTASTDADKAKTTDPAATAAVAPSADVLALRETVQAQSAQIASLQSQQAADKAASQLTKDEARVDVLVRGMKMTAAEGKTWKGLAKSNPTAFEASFSTQEARPVMASLRGGDNLKTRTEMSGDPGAELTRLAQARAQEKNISLGDATKQIVAERGDLAQAHHESAPSFVVGN